MFKVINMLIVLLVAFLAVANCVPTSVLAGTKDSKLNNLKVKRSSSISTESATTSGESVSNRKGSPETLSNAEKSEIPLGNIKPHAGFIETKSTPQKRGVNSQLMYGDLFNSVPAGPARGGVWSDELDPSILSYPEIQDFEDYQRGTFNNKPYENIREMLNQEPIALPLQYPYRYYGDRRKRSNMKPLDARLKRDSKLTPADMLALVALVEAGERSRYETENNDNFGEYSRQYPQYPGPYNQQFLDDEDDDMFVDPSNYVSSPYNFDSIPLYDIVKPPKPAQRFGSKRYMVSKKKRSLGPYTNDVTDRTGLKLNSRYPTHFVTGKAPKRYQTAF